MKFITAEKGVLEVLAISQQNDVWEEPWDVLRGTPIGALFSVVSRRNLNHVLDGFSKPFVSALGIPPEGALRKVSQHCWKKCSLYDPKLCNVLSKKLLPWCFEPVMAEGTSQKVLTQASEAIRYWTEKVYLVVVLEDQLNA